MEDKVEKQKDRIIEMFNVKKEYKLHDREECVTALEDINLNEDSEFKGITKGEFVIIRGPSGGGKTTLLNIMGTIDNATQGTVKVLDQPVDT